MKSKLSGLFGLTICCVLALPASGQASRPSLRESPGVLVDGLHLPANLRIGSVQARPERIQQLITDLGVGSGLRGDCTPMRSKGDLAVMELVKIGLPVVEPLIKIVETIPASDESQDAEQIRARNRRWFAVLILGRIGDKRALPALDACLRHEPAPAVRKGAVYALKALKDPGGEPALILMLHDPYSDIQAAAAQALGDVGSARAVPDLVALLGAPESKQSFHSIGRSLAGKLSPAPNAAQALAKIGTPAVVPLRKALADPDPRTRHFAAVALAASTSPLAKEDRRQLLRHAEPEIRLAAAQNERAFHDPAAVPILAELLRDPTPPLPPYGLSVCGWAAMALAEGGGMPGVKALLAAVHSRDRGEVSAGAAGLRDVSIPQAYDLLLEEVLHGTGAARLSAAEALVHYPDRRTVAAILPMASDVDEKVRTFAVYGLNQLKDARVFPALVKASQDPSEMVRIAVTQILRNRTSDPITPPLLRMLADPVEAVRIYAIGDLATPGNRAALPALRALIGKDTPRVQEAAQQVIAIIEKKQGK